MEPTAPITSDPGNTNLPVTTTDTPVLATTTTAEGADVASVSPPATDALTPSAGTDVAVSSSPAPAPTESTPTPTPTPTPDPTTPAPAPATTSDLSSLSDADKQAFIESYLASNPDYLPELLDKLDDTPSEEREQDIEGYMTSYVQEHPAYAAKLTALLTTPAPAPAPAPEPATPVDTTPVSTTPVVVPTPDPTPAPAPVKQPVPFPDLLYFGKGDACTVNLGSTTVPGTITGIYTDGDGPFYQVEVHIADGVPMTSTRARTIKLDVPADLVS